MPVLTLPWASLLSAPLWAEVVEATEQVSELKPLVLFWFFPSLIMVKIIDWPLLELRVSWGVDLESYLSI